MGRFGEYDGDDYWSEQEANLAMGRWQGRLKQAINGKRGQAVLRKLEELMLAMPEKRLIAGYLTTPKGDCCTVGLYCAAQKAETEGLPNVREAAKALSEGLFAEDWDDDDGDEADTNAYDVEDAGEKAGLTRTLAHELGYQNDYTFDGYTPEERYKKMLAYVQKRIIRETPEPAGMTPGG